MYISTNPRHPRTTTKPQINPLISVGKDLYLNSSDNISKLRIVLDSTSFPGSLFTCQKILLPARVPLMSKQRRISENLHIFQLEDEFTVKVLPRDQYFGAIMVSDNAEKITIL